MKKLLLLGTLCVGCATAGAVQPAYVGEFGNPEEPALRPIKWAISGVGALFFQTGKAFRDGNMNTPVLGTPETLRGAGIGAIELGESIYNGMVYKPLTDYREFKKTHRVNKRINEDLLLRNVRDAASTLWYYPSVKKNDHYPAESDEKVAIRLERAQQTREAREAASAKRDPYAHLSRRERAQMRHVPDRATHSLNKKSDMSGNLLKLAR
ncbi:MAG: hypothetical protein RLZZ303_2807 [Candidatus Hydrogenedentota bacterium]